MKKSKLIATAVLASTLGLAGCGNGAQQCKHVDEKAPWHYCDLCNAKLSEHTFGEWSVKVAPTFEAEGVEHRVCTYPNCGEEETRPLAKLEHHYSGEWSSDNEKHWHDCTDEGYEHLRKDEAAHSVEEWSEYSPADFEHKKVEHGFCVECDKECFREVGDVVPHNYSDQWSFDETNHWHACTDDGYSDLKSDNGPHADSDMNHFCDACEYVIGEHADGDIVDHVCDYCGEELTTLHVDSNHDHLCEVCERVISDHIDVDEDHVCDYCGEEIVSLHIDNDQDHYCDVYACSKKLSDCDDGDVVDHVCDYCGEEMADLHEDGDVVDHVCDVCGKELVYEHYDYLDSNGLCDECGAVMPTVTISAPCDTIGRGETLLLTAVIDPRLGDFSNFEWELTNDGGARWTLTDNEDGTADLYTTPYGASGTGDHAATVLLSSKIDPSYYAEFTGHHSTYGQPKRDSIQNFFGDWMFFPYIGSTTFTDPVLDGDPLTAVSTFSATIVGFNKILGALRNSGNFIEAYDELIDQYHFYGSCESKYDEYCYFDIVVEFDSSAQKTYFTCNKVPSEVSSFPANEIKKILQLPEATYLGAPTDGSYFDYSVYNNRIEVDTDFTASSYVESLVYNGYTCVKSSPTSPKSILTSSDRAVVIEVNDQGSYSVVKISKQVVPDVYEWSKASKKLMLRTFGEVLPFVNGGYLDATLNYQGDLVMSATMSDAAKYAIDAFNADQSYTVDGENPNIFTKEVSDTKMITVRIASNGNISVHLSSLEPVVENKFPMEELSNVIGASAAKDVVEAPGSDFDFVKNDDYDATVTVEGGDRISYMQSLLEHGYAFSSPRVFTKNNLIVEVSVGETYSIHFTLSEIPAGGFPAEEVASYLTGISASDLPSISTGIFNITDASLDDVTLVATDSDIVSFRSALQSAGMTKQDGPGNSWGNSAKGLYADITPGADYSTFNVNFYVFNF